MPFGKSILQILIVKINATAHLPGEFHKNIVFLIVSILSYLSHHMQDAPDPGNWKESSADEF